MTIMADENTARVSGWTKIDTSHYRSPDGRHEAIKSGRREWWLVENTPTGQQWIEPFPHLRLVRDAIEGAAVETPRVELVEDEIEDEFHSVYRVIAKRGDKTIFEVIARRGRIVPPAFIDLSLEDTETLATALMLAAHWVARHNRKEA